MAMKKIYEYTCPECGGDDELETEDMEQDIDCITMRMYCHKCRVSWCEYFLLQYDGYAMNGKVYDKEGEVAEI